MELREMKEGAGKKHQKGHKKSTLSQLCSKFLILGLFIVLWLLYQEREERPWYSTPEQALVLQGCLQDQARAIRGN